MVSLFSLFFLLFSVTLRNLRKKILQYFNLAILFKVIQIRRKRDMTTNMENLPQELVFNILSRLPSRDLFKYKCVSKSWYEIIVDPQFITNYYVVHNNNPRYQEKNLLVIQRPFISSIKTSLSVISLSFNDPKKPISSSLLNLPEEYNSEHKYWSEIMGPCNGIYFLEGNPNVMINPSLKQFKEIPSQTYLTHNTYYSLMDYAGFGFDPKTNDYKVVVLKDLWLKETDERQSGQWTAELYSYNSNTWRKLDDFSLLFPIEISSSSSHSRVYTYVNNRCHWWGFTNESGKKDDIIVSFDMVNEVFRKIKVPKIRESSEENSLAMLTPFEESCSTIGVIVYPIKGNVKLFDVWVMKDYWDEGSWIKKYSVGSLEVLDKVVGFIGNNNHFLWKCNDEGLVLHETESRKSKDLRIYGKYDDSFRASIYKESLVSLQR